MRQYYRKENQSRLIEKICSLKRIFDHKLLEEQLPEVMRFYRDAEITKKAEITFL